MRTTDFSATRRRFLRQLTVASALFAVPGLLAEELVRTPRQTEGPFYPDGLPLDTDNDLILVNDSLTPAVGEITHLSGRLLDSKGQPIRNALVEIWQVDVNGIYLHTQADQARRDAHFQGFGRFLTSSSGEYYFRTIKPVAYGRRTPHVHFAIKTKGLGKWTTQCYIKGEPRNEQDFVYRGLPTAAERAAVTVEFAPLKRSRAGELAARFDLVLPGDADAKAWVREN